MPQVQVLLIEFSGHLTEFARFLDTVRIITLGLYAPAPKRDHAILNDYGMDMITKKRQNLLIVCAGDNSLHTVWHKHRESFDILTIYYGANSEISEAYRKISDLFFSAKGLKIELARNILLNHLLFEESFRFGDYEQIWFPDDDLKFSAGDEQIETIFKLAQMSRADVFQPAIANENYSPAWEATRLINGLFAHRTNIVEVMAHGFSGDTFEKCYLGAIHVCDFMKSGWGIEPLWMKIGEAMYRRSLRTYVLDACSVIHTRPVGSGKSIVHKLGSYEATYIPQIYTNRMKTLSTYTDLTSLEAGWRDAVVSFNEKEIDAYHQPLFKKYIAKRRLMRLLK
jgi:hypothetical protein